MVPLLVGRVRERRPEEGHRGTGTKLLSPNRYYGQGPSQTTPLCGASALRTNISSRTFFEVRSFGQKSQSHQNTYIC